MRERERERELKAERPKLTVHILNASSCNAQEK
jgi:hypothetical protein